MSDKDKVRSRILSYSCQPCWPIVCLTEYRQSEGSEISMLYSLLHNPIHSSPIVSQVMTDIPGLCGKTYKGWGNPVVLNG